MKACRCVVHYPLITTTRIDVYRIQQDIPGGERNIIADCKLVFTYYHIIMEHDGIEF